MSKKAKDPKPKGKKKAKGSSAAEGVRLVSHPRASTQIRKLRAFGGIAGLCLTAYAAHNAGLPAFDVGVRALIGGVVGSMVAWSAAVVVWRHIVIAEFRTAQLRAHAARMPAPAPDTPKAEA